MGRCAHASKSLSSIAPAAAMTAPRTAASGAIHDTTTMTTPPAIKSGVASARMMFATGATSGKTPEKYMMYGSMNIGIQSASIRSSRALMCAVWGTHALTDSTFGKTAIMKNVARNDK